MTINNSTYFYIPDIQGTIRAIVAENGSVMAEYTYDAWGSPVSYNGSLAKENDYLYTGREYDWETGIYYYRARYYNPEIGRFLQQDPAGMVDGPNMYVYVKNGPVNGVDPWGYIFGDIPGSAPINECISRCGSDWNCITDCLAAIGSGAGTGGGGVKGKIGGPGDPGSVGGIRHMGFGTGRDKRNRLIIGGVQSTVPPYLPPELQWVASI